MHVAQSIPGCLSCICWLYNILFCWLCFLQKVYREELSASEKLICSNKAADELFIYNRKN